MFGKKNGDDDVLDSQQAQEQVNAEKASKKKKFKGSDSDILDGKKKGKTGIIIGAVAAVVVIAIVAKMVLGGGGSSSGGYYDVTNTVLTSELGAFRYTINVRTSAKGEDVKPVEGAELDNTGEPGSTAEPQEGETPAPTEEPASFEQEEDTHKKTYDWAGTGSYETDGWRYPNYAVTIEGRALNVDPYEVTFSIGIVTDYINEAFTDVTFKDGKYYVNVEQMRYWLVSSKDKTLAEIGNKMPEGSKYLVIPENEFSLTSRYAEANEADKAKVTDLYTAVKRMKTFLGGVVQIAKSNIGETGLVTSDDGTSSVNLTGENAGAMVNFIRSFASGVGSFWDSYVSACGTDLYYSEEGVQQANAERDNFVSAFKDFNESLSLVNDDYIDAKAEGTSRQYKNTSGSDTVESSLRVAFNLDETYHQIEISMLRSGDNTEIKIPEGSTVELKDYRSKTLVEEVFNDVMDYFEPLGIDLGKSMEVSPDAVVDSLMKDFLQLVNSSQDYVTVTESTVVDYVKKYANFEVGDDTSEEDVVNAMIVNDFLTSLKRVTGGVVRRENVKDDSDSETEQFPVSKVKLSSDTNATVNYNTGKSDSGVVAVDAKFSGKNTTLKAEDFELRDLQGSLYKANNIILLSGLVDKGKLPQKFSGKSKVTLYFPVSQDVGYLDLWYKGTKVAVIRAY